jgi:hypothetical protein
VQIVATGDITLNQPISSGASGKAVVLAAGGNFINNTGSAALSLPGGGRWLIYSSNPASDTFGNLASGNKAIWNATFASKAPGTITQIGNRYLFSYQPTITYTSTSLSKTYGDDLSSSIATAYTSDMLPLQTNTYGGVLVADAIADFAMPTVTSSGAAPTANVSGSPYSMMVSGSSTLSNGYALVYNSTGSLTINPASYTAISGAKVYDGSAGFSSVTLTGVNGETFTVASVTSNSANVIVTNHFTNATGITGNGGASTSNYHTLDFEALTSNTATITPAPLKVTANDYSKPYDGVPYSGGNGVMYAGFVNGENQNVLGGALTYGGTLQGAANAGTYGIDPSGLTSGNYAITYGNGTLTIQQPVSEPQHVPPTAPVQTGTQTPQGNPSSALFTLVDTSGAVLPIAVSVHVNNNPAGGGGSIRVNVPSAQGHLSGGFRLSLPPGTVNPDVLFTITQGNGAPLPSWLSFDSVAQSFSATDVPAGIQSLNLVISQGKQTWTIQIAATTPGKST